MNSYESNANKQALKEKSATIYGGDLALFLYLEVISMTKLTVLQIEILQYWACLYTA